MPSWLATPLRIALLGVLGFALAAMPLALLGIFHPLAVGIAWVAAWGGLQWAWGLSSLRGSALRPFTGRHGNNLAAAGVVAFVIAASALNSFFAVEHLRVDRDPGVYTVTGLWLARHGELLYEPDREAFGGQKDLSFGGGGFYKDAPGGRFYPQFLHLLPAAMAAAFWIGGYSLMFAVNAFIGALALLAFYAFACRLVSPLLALAATVALGVNLVQIFVTRDAYSEILTQMFIFGGLWLLTEAECRPSSARYLLAGLMLGATALTRIDALLYIIGGMGLVFVVIMTSRWADRAPSSGLFFAAGLALPTALALVDGVLYARPYLAALRDELVLMGMGLGIVVAGGLALSTARSRLPRLWSAVSRRRGVLAAISAGAILAASAFAWVVRPRLWDSTSHAEDTMLWLSWYLGPATLAIGLIGAALGVATTVKRPTLALSGLLAVFVMPAALYVQAPRINSNHLWAMRRFLPVILPGLLLVGFWAVDRWLDLPIRRSLVKLRGAAAAVLVIIAVVVPLSQTAPLWKLSDQKGVAASVRAMCSRLGSKASVVFTSSGPWRELGVGLPAVCGVPTAIAPLNADRRYFEDLAGVVGSRGRSLFVLSSDGLPFTDGAEPPPGTEAWIDVLYPQPVKSHTERPANIKIERWLVYVTRVRS